jgi:hypothetical protein
MSQLKITQLKICSRCGGNFKIEKHHIVHRVNGGKDSPENLIPLCWHCHKYQHTKESILDEIKLATEQMKTQANAKRFYYWIRNLKLLTYRLEVNEELNTVMNIHAYGYRKYWKCAPETHSYDEMVLHVRP